MIPMSMCQNHQIDGFRRDPRQPQLPRQPPLAATHILAHAGINQNPLAVRRLQKENVQREIHLAAGW